MEEYAKTGSVEVSALRTDMDRKTARKYLRTGRLPSELRRRHEWRTRKNPFAEVWVEVTDLLERHAGIDALTVFEELKRRYPDRFQDGQLRTLQRHVRGWRAEHGPAKEVFFPQEHRAGEAMQTDFTSTSELGITIHGQPYNHLICHSVFPFSNWEAMTACVSESMAALKRGVQRALFALGRVPGYHQTDHSTAATHRLGGGEGGRGFNEEYERFCLHFGMKPRTTGVGKKEQNGDVESSHGALKRRLEQRLLMRGNRDFESVASYEAWLKTIGDEANQARSTRVRAEIEAMRPIPARAFPEYSEIDVRVTTGSTISVKKNTYSVPSRLIGEMLTVHVYETLLEVYYGKQMQFSVERLHGEGGHRVNYRHIVEWLVRKPGAFERYRYREDLFPTITFRRAYDALLAGLSARRANIDYLGILHLAARTMESRVEAVVMAILATGEMPTIERVKAVIEPERPATPEIAPIDVNLSDYDGLLEEAM